MRCRGALQGQGGNLASQLLFLPGAVSCAWAGAEPLQGQQSQAQDTAGTCGAQQEHRESVAAPLLLPSVCSGLLPSPGVWGQEEGLDDDNRVGKRTAGNGVLEMSWDALGLLDVLPIPKSASLSQLGSHTYSQHYHICRELLSVGKDSLCDLGEKERSLLKS